VAGLLPLRHLDSVSQARKRTRPLAFRGTFEYTLDAKNRLTVPAKFRSELAGGVVLAKGVERCVAVWTPAGYEEYTREALSGLHPASPDAHRLQRFFSANAFDTELDGAGRVGVPGQLLEHAGLGKDVVVAGAGGWLEVWDRQAWTAYNEDLTATVSDITANLGHPA
jgi:MraZ protein